MSDDHEESQDQDFDVFVEPDGGSQDVDDIAARLEGESLLGLLFSLEEIRQLLELHPAEEFEGGTAVLRAGQPSDTLCISLDNELKILSPLVEEFEFEQASLGAGRAFNLYALLRGLPYQYTLTTKEDVRILRIPWRVVEARLAQLPVAREYLMRITENSDFQQTAKDITHAGCSKAFRIAFLTSLSLKSARRQTWIAKQTEPTIEAVQLLRGEALALTHGNSEGPKRIESRWNLPQRVWVLWQEETNGFGLWAQTDVAYFSIERGSADNLSERFPDDFEKWSLWLSRSGISGTGKENSAVESDIDVDLDAALAGTKYSRGAWKPFPWVAQNDAMDCGAACLTMISQYYGKKFPIQYWRTQMSTGREGTTLFDLAQTGERNGFITYALSADKISEIPEESYPVIVLRKFHYVILYAKKRSRYVIGDPGAGIHSMTAEELNDGFDKVFLVLRPTPSFHSMQPGASQGAQFWPLLSNFKRELSLALVSSILIVLASVVPPVAIQSMLDDVLSTGDIDLLKLCLGAFVGYTVFNAVLSWARAYFLQYVAVKLDFLTKTSFLQRLLNLPYDFFASRHIGDFTRRLQEFETVRSFLTEKSLSFILSIVSLVVYMSVLFIYSAKIGFVILALAPAFVVVSMLFTRRLTSTYGKYFSAKAEEDGFVADLIRGIQSVKVSGAELSMRRKFEVLLVRALQERYSFHLTSVALHGIVGFMFELSKYGVMVFAIWLAMRGEISSGQVVAIFMLVGEVLGPFQKMALHWADLQEAKMVISRLNDVYLTAPETKTGEVSGQRRESLKGTIEFRDVWFRYGGESSEWVLKGTSFKISSGEKVAIVGPSGSGKSTIAMLLNRLYSPQKGQILIDGKDIREFDLSWLRERVGMVCQEPHLFPGTVAENISLSGEYSDEATIRIATDIADSTKFIEEKPGAFDAFIPAGGHGLSGGEKQRVALSRALHRNPDMLVLDEATSALDGITEKNFLERVNVWGKEKTIVSIAHRYSTVVRSQSVIILESGRVVGVGSPTHLGKSHAVFRALFGFDADASRAAA